MNIRLITRYQINAIIIALILIITSCTHKEQEQPSSSKENAEVEASSPASDEPIMRNETTVMQYSSIAFKLASINAGQYVATSDPTVKAFGDLISELSSKYVEDEQRIADITVKSHEMLKEIGISTSLLDMMKGMNQLVSEKDAINRYGEFMAAYHTLRKSGESHNEAILNTKALLRSMGVK